MTTEPQPPARLASEDVIINAPFSYAGSAQRIWRLRRRASAGGALVAITVCVGLLVVLAWTFVTTWYLTWGLLLVPYRLLRRGARKRKAEAMRHRELMGAIQGSAAASSATIVSAMTTTMTSTAHPSVPPSPTELVADVDRDRLIEEFREHLLAGRLSAEEFEDRVAAAHAARTRADLKAAGADLPGVWQ